MFTLIPCAAGCGRSAISGTNICAVHAADPAKEMARIAAYIGERQIIKDLNAPGLSFEGTDFSHRQFYGCNFY
ncbi:MAG: pentapeptide repeat-containing protein, partial [Treponema sp.]|nr:pentapeptide repeat-containing protein [Treponema sp.]